MELSEVGRLKCLEQIESEIVTTGNFGAGIYAYCVSDEIDRLRAVLNADGRT